MTYKEYLDSLCDCSCADPCPFGHVGSTERCQMTDLEKYFGCTGNELKLKIKDFREKQTAINHELFKKWLKKNKIEISIVEANRPE